MKKLGKLEWTKPELRDLGSATTKGNLYPNGICTGGSAYFIFEHCSTGQNAKTMCNTGSSVGLPCTVGGHFF